MTLTYGLIELLLTPLSLLICSDFLIFELPE